jgi:sugar O-acyltransferase (sialic acid O-acetyltransferase NeuD family)
MPDSAHPFVVIGGGGHAKVVLSILRKFPERRILGYTDMTDRGVILGAPYLGSDHDLASRAASGGFDGVLGVGQVGTGQKRRAIWSELRELALDFPPLISPHAVLNLEGMVGEASVVMDGAIIASGASLGRGVIANTNCTVEHDSLVSDWAHIGPGATLSGGVTVGRFSMIGAGATVIEGIKIAESCLVGAGATVVNDLTEAGVYAGCPARRIK